MGKETNFLKTTQLASGEASIQTQAVWLSSHSLTTVLLGECPGEPCHVSRKHVTGAYVWLKLGIYSTPQNQFIIIYHESV